MILFPCSPELFPSLPNLLLYPLKSLLYDHTLSPICSVVSLNISCNFCLNWNQRTHFAAGQGCPMTFSVSLKLKGQVFIPLISRATSGPRLYQALVKLPTPLRHSCPLYHPLPLLLPTHHCGFGTCFTIFFPTSSLVIILSNFSIHENYSSNALNSEVTSFSSLPSLLLTHPLTVTSYIHALPSPQTAQINGSSPDLCTSKVFHLLALVHPFCSVSKISRLLTHQLFSLSPWPSFIPESLISLTLPRALLSLSFACLLHHYRCSLCPAQGAECCQKVTLGITLAPTSVQSSVLPVRFTEFF